MVRAIDAQEKQWQRESDARTLAEAEEIKTDKTRMGGAKKEAKVMAKRDEKRATAMKKVAAGKVAPKKTTPAKKAAPKAKAKAAPKKTASRGKKK